MRDYYGRWWRSLRDQVRAEWRSYRLGVIAAIALAIVAPPIASLFFNGGAVSKLSELLFENALISLGVLVIIGLLLFVPAALKAPVTLYAQQNIAIDELQGRIRDSAAALASHEERLRPKLSLHFGGRVAPYYAEIQSKPMFGDGVLESLFRVGIANDSTADIDDVEVILNGCSLKVGGGIHLSERLQISGGKATVRVPPGPPVIFADLVGRHTEVPSAQPKNNVGYQKTYFCYFNTSLRTPVDKHSFTFSVLLLGGGVRDEMEFSLTYGSDNTIQVVQNPRPGT